MPRSAWPAANRSRARVAVLVGEGEIVEAAHEGAVDRLVARRRSCAATRGSRSRRSRRSRAGRVSRPKRSEPRITASMQVDDLPDAPQLVVVVESARSSWRSRALSRSRRRSSCERARADRPEACRARVCSSRVPSISAGQRRERPELLSESRPCSASTASGEPSKQRVSPGRPLPACRSRDAFEQRADQSDAAQDVVGDASSAVGLRPGSPGRPAPAAAAPSTSDQLAVGGPIGERRAAAPGRTRPASRRSDSARVPTELGVALAHQAEGVLVEAHPEVQAVLLDAARRSASRGALAAEPPAELVDGDAGSGPACSGRVSSKAAAIAAQPPPTIATLIGFRVRFLESGSHRQGAILRWRRRSAPRRILARDALKPRMKSAPNRRAGVWNPGS